MDMALEDVDAKVVDAIELVGCERHHDGKFGDGLST